MNILHGFWLPESGSQFIQSGQFCLWVETAQNVSQTVPQEKIPIHPRHLYGNALSEFLQQQLQLLQLDLADAVVSHTVMLPTANDTVLASPELKHELKHEFDGESVVSLQPWQVECVILNSPLQALSHIYFINRFQVHDSDCRLGSDFEFWHYFSQAIKPFIVKEQYIPSLLQGDDRVIYRGWQLVSADYEHLLSQASKQMPLICTMTSEAGFEAQSMLRHFAEVTVHQLLEQASEKLPQSVQKPFNDTVLETLFTHNELLGSVDLFHDEYEKWHHWQHQIVDLAQNTGVQLCFRLREGLADAPDDWSIEFVAASRQDPSFKKSLASYWNLDELQKQALEPLLGAGFEHQILTTLGGAARIYPKIWQGMSTQQPKGVQLTLEQAFAFLKEQAWVLEDAGYKVIVPSWWTPKGRQRAKVKLRSKDGSGGSSSSSDSGKGLMSMDSLINYHYELAIGDEKVTTEEWAQLLEAKSPLIQFRGQWMELEPDKMAHMLEFWQRQGDEGSQATASELMKMLAEQDHIFELDKKDALAGMLGKLVDQSALELIDDPEQLNANLRDYQKRGVSWLRYLDQLGLNGCLADDMGLGKTMQVIANLVLIATETSKAASTKKATLLIAPTSVMGNWQKEVEKFAPHLTTVIHHGAARLKDASEFKALVDGHHMVITSYSLARRDSKLLGQVNWQRIVLDEAQNIKNPKSAQSKAIFKLKGVSRLALTGTPVENRLMDLWSIFNFLNPGYLGTQAQFRKTYELPIQRHNSATQSSLLKKLIEPFILRRLKTDKNIIKDLPDKVENKLYCNLSKEQAALYEAVVEDVEMQLAEKEGIELQGLMLSTLMKLKQICNHPMQFLQDGSEFTPQRSHKLERLGEMLEEAQADGDSVLIFTQFTDIGEQLVKYLSHEKQLNCYYMHGGVSRKKRESMIEAFQDPATPPSVFVLSLKAGGVGITLTRANHVFHFDRWWNPAVEDQATDRAFRIGQKKNVFVHKFITLGTLEERIDLMIEDKKQMADSVVGDGESWLSKLDNEAFKSLIALNKQSVVE